MGMDIHGLNPKQNRKLEDFPILHKYRKMDDDDEYEKKWNELGLKKETAYGCHGGVGLSSTKILSIIEKKYLF